MSTKRVQRNLTIMFTDISGFTKHTEKISREKLMDRLDTHNKLLMPIVAHFEGNIVKTIGDSFMITFESPTNAVECGTFMQHTLGKFNAGKPEAEQIHIKVSINAGEVTVTDNDVFGDAVNVAAKIEKVTSPDEIYFTESVFLSMNKAEVPNAFVKTFRPKGADSQEIKLYKVVQDENEPMYKRIVDDTRIDKDKMKTRVLELSKLAEKEYSRYQDALEQLVTQHGRTSRTGIIATVAAALIIGGAIVVGFMFTRPDPAKQLEVDVRAFLVSDKPKDARTVIEHYVKQHGETPAAVAMLAEIRSFEQNSIEREALGLIAQGKPDIALTRITAFLGNDKPGAGLEKALGQARGYVEAQTLLEKGDFRGAARRIEEIFGNQNPGEPLRLLREQAATLRDAGEMLAGDGAADRAGQAISLLTKVFGDQSANPVFLEVLTRALILELGGQARKEGPTRVLERAEELKKRYVRLTSWPLIQREVNLEGLWYSMVDNKFFRDLRYYDSPSNRIVQALRKDALDRKDADFMWRLGDTLFRVNRAKYQSTLDGLWECELAIKIDPDIARRKPDFQDRLSYYLGITQTADAENEDEPEKKDFWFGRESVKKYYYKDLRDRLIKGLSAEHNGKPWLPERINCFCILAEMGEASQLKDKVAFVQSIWRELFEKQQIHTSHIRLLFAEPMTYEQYQEFRVIMDRVREDTAFSVYGHRFSVLDQMIKDIKELQPAHTAQYGK